MNYDIDSGIASTDGDPGTLIVPIARDEVAIVQLLPKGVRETMARNIQEYIRTLGKEYHVSPNTGQPQTV